jgi:glycolate oxidase
MQYKTINQTDIQFFESVVGKNFVLVQNEDKENYTHDYTEDLRFMPDVVVKPSNKIEVSAILKYCNEQHIIVIPRGAGTGTRTGPPSAGCPCT